MTTNNVEKVAQNIRNICSACESDVLVGEDAWFVTITVKPSMSYSNRELLNQHLLDVFPHLGKSLKSWCLVPELSPQNNLLHYHGWYVVKDKYKFFRATLPMLGSSCGFIKYNKCRDHRFLGTYYCKDLEKTLPQFLGYWEYLPICHISADELKEDRKFIKKLFKGDKYNKNIIDV